MDVRIPGLRTSRMVPGHVGESQRHASMNFDVSLGIRAHRRAQLRAEAERLRNDPEDVEASRELAAEMDSIRAW